MDGCRAPTEYSTFSGNPKRSLPVERRAHLLYVNFDN